jgi:hypothetical protein
MEQYKFSKLYQMIHLPKAHLQGMFEKIWITLGILGTIINPRHLDPNHKALNASTKLITVIVNDFQCIYQVIQYIILDQSIRY